MAILGNRRDMNPILLNPDGSIANPKRVPFTEKMFDEAWLQGLIEDHPELLPISEIEPAFAPAISVGREVTTASGYIDNLLLSSQGYLTIVETKLWRNPEARREVVGQIIEYAKDVSHWTFQKLEGEVRKYNAEHRKSKDGILDSLRRIEDIDENKEGVIIDAISRNLQAGRFLLLVVGEGIRESVEEMADFLQRTPQLLFTLALVELQIYKISEKEGDQQLLVIPQVVARTREITRAVVRIEGKDIESVRVEVDTEITTAEKSGKRFTLSEEDFFNILSQRVDAEDVELAHQIIEDVQGLGCIIEWRQGSFVVKLPDPEESGQKLTLLVVKKEGLTYLGWLDAQLRSIGIPEQIASDYYRESSELFGGNGRMVSEAAAKQVSLKELRQKYNEFMSLLKKTIDSIKEASER